MQHDRTVVHTLAMMTPLAASSRYSSQVVKFGNSSWHRLSVKFLTIFVCNRDDCKSPLMWSIS